MPKGKANRGSAEPASKGRGKRATIRDVAAAAGVSTATVSHVLSGNQPVSQAATDKVLEVAAAMAYKANSSARGLATGRSFMFGLHVPLDAGDMVINPFFATVLMTISATASADGYGMILLPAAPEQAADQVESLVDEQRIDGVLLLDPLPADVFVSALETAELPVVAIGRVDGRPNIPVVDGDVGAQVTEALDHLVARGFERPALLTVSSRASFFDDSEGMYRQWCEDAGKEPQVYMADAVTEDAAFGRVLDVSERFDGVLCISDVLASGALRAIQSKPQHHPVGIIGMGDSFYAKQARVPLTSIATFPGEKGALATKMLLQLIDGQELKDRQQFVPHELIERESTLKGVTSDD